MTALRLFHISDIHFGLEDERALAWVEQCIAREQPAAICVTGDLTMRARHREFREACRWIASVPRPWPTAWPLPSGITPKCRAR